MLDSSAKLKDMIQDGGGGRAGAIHAISRVLTSTIKSLLAASLYDWIEEDEGEQRVAHVGTWPSFAVFKDSDAWLGFAARTCHYSYIAEADDIEKVEAAWNDARSKWLEDEEDLEAQRERALAACEAAAKEYGIPFDRDLALSSAQCQAAQEPDWITSNC